MNEYIDTESYRETLKQGYKEFEREIGWKGIENVQVSNIREMHDRFKDRIASIAGRVFHFGFSHIDRMVRGIIPSHMCVVCARPGVGKTNLLLTILKNQCSQGKRVIFFSLEMSEMELYERCCQMSCQIAGGEVLQRTREGGPLYDAMTEAVGRDFGGMHVVDQTGLTAKNIFNVVALWEEHLRVTYDAVFIDYFNLLKCEERNQGPYDRASIVARELQAMTKEVDKPVICASQLRRGKAANEKPCMDDLRDSGVLEEVSAVIIGLWRSKEETLNAAILKNKRGKLGSFEMDFEVESLTIHNDRYMAKIP